MPGRVVTSSDPARHQDAIGCSPENLVQRTDATGASLKANGNHQCGSVALRVELIKTALDVLRVIQRLPV
jgi:hypothetical protein